MKQMYYDNDFLIANKHNKLLTILKHPIVIKWAFIDKCNLIRSMINKFGISYSDMLISGLLAITTALLINKQQIHNFAKILFEIPMCCLSLTLTILLVMCLLSDCYNHSNKW